MKNLMQRQPMSQVLLFPILVLVPMLIQFVGATIDGQLKVRDSQGYLVWISTSAHSKELEKYLIVVLLLLALVVLIRDSRGAKTLLSLPVVILLWPIALLVSTSLRADKVGIGIIVVSLVVYLALVVSQPRDRDFLYTARVVVGITVVAAIYSFVDPGRALISCRADKCSIWGGLLTSFMPQENVLALFALGGLMLVAFAMRGGERVFAIILISIILYSTGSRGAIIAGIAVLSIHFCGYLAKKYRVKNRVAFAALSLIPITMTLASGLGFFVPGIFGSLTGRDFIMNLLLGYWEKSPIIGPGRQVLADAYNAGNSANFLMSHEHGQMPYVFISGGLIAAIPFVFFVFRLSHSTRSFGRDQVALLGLLVGISIIFLTEPAWQFDVRAPTFWTFAFASVLYVRLAKREQPRDFGNSLAPSARTQEGSLK
jgi:hypothetical protein